MLGLASRAVLKNGKAALALFTDTAITPKLWLASGCAGCDCNIAR